MRGQFHVTLVLAFISIFTAAMPAVAGGQAPGAVQQAGAPSQKPADIQMSKGVATVKPVRAAPARIWNRANDENGRKLGRVGWCDWANGYSLDRSVDSLPRVPTFTEDNTSDLPKVSVRHGERVESHGSEKFG